MAQAMITTTVPWIDLARLGHSTFCSSAHDSRMKRPRCARLAAGPSASTGGCAPGRDLRLALRARALRGGASPRRAARSRCVAALPDGSRGPPSGSPGAACAEPHQRQYFLNSTRSGVFRFDFFVW